MPDVCESFRGCLCYCKDTNFKANHNTQWTDVFIVCVVYATAKILILKQITTATGIVLFHRELFMLLQRY